MVNESHIPFVPFEAFQKIDIRVGRVLDVQAYPKGKYSTHILQIDFGPKLGIKQSLAKLTPNYSGPEIIERQVVAVVNFKPKQIGEHISEVLTLGLADKHGNVILIHPDKEVPLGGRLY